MIPFNLYITYFLYKKIRGYRLWQVMMYQPGMIGSLVVVTAFKKFIEPNGPLGTLLKFRGVNPVPEFLQNSDTVFITILLYSLWMGWISNLLLLGGALARISVEILEAARLNGVGPIPIGEIQIRKICKKRPNYTKKTGKNRCFSLLFFACVLQNLVFEPIFGSVSNDKYFFTYYFNYFDKL